MATFVCSEMRHEQPPARMFQDDIDPATPSRRKWAARARGGLPSSFGRGAGSLSAIMNEHTGGLVHERASLRRVLFHSAFALLAAAVVPVSTSAQSFRLDRFRSAERADDGFGVRRMGAFGHMRFGANAVADYANDPLVIRRNIASDRQLQSIVKHELVLKVDLSLALWDRVILFAGFDAPLVMKGPSVRPGLNVPGADGAGFGDVSLGARVRLLGDADDVFALGLQAVAIICFQVRQKLRTMEA